MHEGWIGVDLDGTLAYYDGWKGPAHIGRPIVAMLERVKRWIAEGRDVRIVTARVSSDGTTAGNHEAALARQAIQEYCTEHVGKALPVTHQKDFNMIELWDDRCVQVVANTGVPVGYSTRGLTDGPETITKMTEVHRLKRDG